MHVHVRIANRRDIGIGGHTAEVLPLQIQVAQTVTRRVGDIGYSRADEMHIINYLRRRVAYKWLWAWWNDDALRMKIWLGAVNRRPCQIAPLTRSDGTLLLYSG